MIDKNKLLNNNSNLNTNEDDIDSILKELEDKNSKRRENKLPFLNTKDKFNQKKPDPNILRESKTELKHGEPYKFIEKDDWKHIKNFEDKNHFKPLVALKDLREEDKQQQIYVNKISRHKSPIEAPQANKFSYSFQPALNQLNHNKDLPSSKSVNRGHMNLGGLGFLSLPKPPMMLKQKPDLMPLNAYKY